MDPVTCGVAIDVPLEVPVPPLLLEVVTNSPGASRVRNEAEFE
jgi:hypothetical protein